MTPLPVRAKQLTAAAAVLIMAVIGIAAAHHNTTRPAGNEHIVSTLQFPDIDRAALTPLQARILDVTEAQWHAQPAATTFTEGVDEPWCADFVSWILREAGAPLRNPNSGSWRIPGVYTMQEYFQRADRLQPAQGYRPQPGDIVLWGPDSTMGLHANIVVAADSSTITTVGGNEGGITVRVNPGDSEHLLGFGQPA